MIHWGNLLHEGDFPSRHVIHRLVFQKRYCRNVSLEKMIYSSWEDMNSIIDVIFEHDQLYYTLNVLNKKIMLIMTLLKMYIIFSCLIYYQYLINPFQGCQQYPLLKNYVDR